MKEQFIDCWSLLTAWPFKTFCNNSTAGRKENFRLLDCPLELLSFRHKNFIARNTTFKTFLNLSSYTMACPPFHSTGNSVSCLPFPEIILWSWSENAKSVYSFLHEKRLGHILPLLRSRGDVLFSSPSPPAFHVSDKLAVPTMHPSILTVVLEQINKSLPFALNLGHVNISFIETLEDVRKSNVDLHFPVEKWILLLPFYTSSLTHILKMGHKTFSGKTEIT